MGRILRACLLLALSDMVARGGIWVRNWHRDYMLVERCTRGLLELIPIYSRSYDRAGGHRDGVAWDTPTE